MAQSGVQQSLVARRIGPESQAPGVFNGAVLHARWCFGSTVRSEAQCTRFDLQHRVAKGSEVKALAASEKVEAARRADKIRTR